MDNLWQKILIENLENWETLRYRSENAYSDGTYFIDIMTIYSFLTELTKLFFNFTSLIEKFIWRQKRQI